VKLKGKVSIAPAGMEIACEMKQTLAESSPTRAVIEQEMSTNGQAQRKERQEVAGDGWTHLLPGVASKEKRKGREALTLGGKRCDCTWVEYEGTQGGTKFATKVWRSPRIPGGVVKMEMTGGDGTLTYTMTLEYDGHGK
jgi:hypothetical protein